MTENPLIMVIAGEASGDLHGAKLISSIKKMRPASRFFGVGGDKMAGEGMELIRHSKEMAFMGIFEIISHLPFIRAVFRQLTDALLIRRPSLLILIDYPGFNLRFAKTAKKYGIPVLYYISPKIWAWGAGRMKRIKKSVDHMAVIFPFEELLYRNHGVPVTFVGNPLKDHQKTEIGKTGSSREKSSKSQFPWVGLLPGSRHQEIDKLLPVMLKVCQILKSKSINVRFSLGRAVNIPDSFYNTHLQRYSNISITDMPTSEVMKQSKVVLVASGTATLEAALVETPMLILYKMAPLSYLIGRLLVKVPFIGLVNIVAGKKIVPEFIQNQAKPIKIAQELISLISDESKIQRVRRELRRVSDALGDSGASDRTAEIVLRMTS